MLRIRLRRVGGTNAPSYRIVVSASARTPRGSQLVDELGFYDPTRSPVLLKVDTAKAQSWIAKGAQASATVKRILKSAAAPAVVAAPAA